MMQKTYRGYKILAEDLDSIVNYNFQVLGVWVGCPNPEKFLHPEPKKWKEGKMTYIDSNVIINCVVEDPNLKEGETSRIRLVLGLHPTEDKAVSIKRRVE